MPNLSHSSLEPINALKISENYKQERILKTHSQI